MRYTHNLTWLWWVNPHWLPQQSLNSLPTTSIYLSTTLGKNEVGNAANQLFYSKNPPLPWFTPEEANGDLSSFISTPRQKNLYELKAASSFSSSPYLGIKVKELEGSRQTQKKKERKIEEEKYLLLKRLLSGN